MKPISCAETFSRSCLRGKVALTCSLVRHDATDLPRTSPGLIKLFSSRRRVRFFLLSSSSSSSSSTMLAFLRGRGYRNKWRGERRRKARRNLGDAAQWEIASPAWHRSLTPPVNDPGGSPSSPWWHELPRISRQGRNYPFYIGEESSVLS